MEIITDIVKLKEFIDNTDYQTHFNDSSIKKYIDDAFIQFKNMENTTKELMNAEEAFKKYNIPYDKNVYDNALSDLVEKENDYNNHIKLVYSLLKEKEDKCEHEFSYEGHDSHYDYYVCQKCGKQEKD